MLPPVDSTDSQGSAVAWWERYKRPRRTKEEMGVPGVRLPYLQLDLCIEISDPVELHTTHVYNLCSNLYWSSSLVLAPY